MSIMRLCFIVDMRKILGLTSAPKQVAYARFVFISFCVGAVAAIIADSFPKELIACHSLLLLSGLCIIAFLMSPSILGIYVIPIVSVLTGFVCEIFAIDANISSFSGAAPALPLLFLVPVFFLVSARGMLSSAMINAELKRSQCMGEISGMLLPQILLAAFAVLIAINNL